MTKTEISRKIAELRKQYDIIKSSVNEDPEVVRAKKNYDEALKKAKEFSYAAINDICTKIESLKQELSNIKK